MSTTTLTVGVDPGMTGAIAILDPYGLVAVYDMPCGNGAVSAQQVAALADWADSTVFGTVVIEDVHSMPKQGVASSFGFGRSKGVVEGVFAMARRPLVYVAPSTWKRHLGLSKDKGASRQRAVELWPDRADLFKLAKHDGRAEAALIARWYLTKETTG
jgi:crossover junction endodeoxyribonuclease RuvC